MNHQNAYAMVFAHKFIMLHDIFHFGLYMRFFFSLSLALASPIHASNPQFGRCQSFMHYYTMCVYHVM